MKQHYRLLLGLVLGLFLGAIAHSWNHVEWIQFTSTSVLHPIGQIFLRMIFMVVVPLVFSALVLGVFELSKSHGLGRIAWRTLGFTAGASALSVIIGVALVNAFRPGTYFKGDGQLPGSDTIAAIQKNANLTKPFSESLIELIPKNPIDSAARALDGEMVPLMVFALIFGIALSAVRREQKGQKSSDTDNVDPENISEANPIDHKDIPKTHTVGQKEISVTNTAHRNIISNTNAIDHNVVSETHNGGLENILDQIFQTSMKVISYAMAIAPAAVFAIVFNTAFRLGLQSFQSLLFYVFVVVLGLAIQQLVVYSSLLKMFTDRSPFHFFHQCRDVYLYAFSTASSNATLPTSLHVAETKLGIPKTISRFVLTIGSTANQNGTALFEGITILFLAQVYGVELTLMQQVKVVMMSILAGIGTAGVPGGSLPLIMIVLTSVGIPAEGLGLILGMDRFLDMCRTTLNVSGDLVIAALVEGKPNRR